MSMHTELFPVQILQWLFNVTEFILRPFIACFNGVVCPFIPTTVEKQNHGSLLLQRLFTVPLYLTGLCLLMSPALLAFCIRNILYQFRKPYCVSVGVKERPSLIDNNDSADNCESITANGPSSGNSTTAHYTIATMNLCLFTEFMSKLNNLSDVSGRARQIAEKVVIDQLHYKGMTKHRPNTLLSPNTNDLFTNPENGIDSDIVSHFSHLDFVCLQEAWHRDMSKSLIKEFQKVFPWIVYDVGYNSPRLNYCAFNSGLMFASRHKVIDVDFKPYSAKCGNGCLFNKGLLMIKVLLGSDHGAGDGPGADNSRSVGYIFNTHLQAFQGDKPIIQQQLADICRWTEEFRQQTHNDCEKVVFDVVCGDFNIDNMSPGDAALQTNPLFSLYTDPCRKAPGRDHDWAVGTELRPLYLLEDEISTPDGLRTAMMDPYLRQRYLLDADLEMATMDSIYNSQPKTDSDGNIVLSPVGGKRRIDYILYRTDCPVKVERYSFVSRLASLTDHIPVSMTFQPTA